MKNKNLAIICAYDDLKTDVTPRGTRGVRAITDSCSVHDFLGRGSEPKEQGSKPLYKLACRLFGMSRSQRRSEIGRLTDSQRRQLLGIRQRIVDSAIDYPPNIAWAIEDLMSGGGDGYSELYKTTSEGMMPIKQFPEVGKWVEAVSYHGVNSPEAKKAAKKLGNYKLLGRVHDDDALDAYLAPAKEQEGDLANAVETAAAEATTLSEDARRKLDETKNELEQEAQSFVAGLVDTVSQIIPSIVFEQAATNAAEEAAAIVEETDEKLDEKADEEEDKEAKEAELSDRLGLEYREDNKMGDSVSVAIHASGDVSIETPSLKVETAGDEVRANILGYADPVNPDEDVARDVIEERVAAQEVDAVPEAHEDVTVEEAADVFDNEGGAEEDDYTEDIPADVFDSIQTRLSEAGRAILDAIGDEDAVEAAVEAFRSWLQQEWDLIQEGGEGVSGALESLADELREPLQLLGVTPTETDNAITVDGDPIVEVSDTAMKVGTMSYEFDLNSRLTGPLLRNAGYEFGIVVRGVANISDGVTVADDAGDDLLSERAKEEVLARVNEALKKRLEEKGIEISDALPKDTMGALDNLIDKGWGPQLLMGINSHFAKDPRRYREIQRKLAERYGEAIEYIADIDTLADDKQEDALQYLTSELLTEADRIAILGEMFNETPENVVVTDGIKDILKGAVNLGKKVINNARLEVGDRIQAGEAIVEVVKKKVNTFLAKLPNGRFKEFKYPKKLVAIPKDAIDPNDYPNGAPDYMVTDAADDAAAIFIEEIDRIYGPEDEDKRKAVDDILQAVGEDVRKDFEEAFRRSHNEDVPDAKASDVLKEYAAWASADNLMDLAAFFKSLYEGTNEAAADETVNQPVAGEGSEKDVWAELDAKNPMDQLRVIFEGFNAEELEKYLYEASNRLGFASLFELLQAIADNNEVALRLVADFKENAPQEKYEAVEVKLQELVGDAMDPNEDGDDRVTINWTKEKFDEYIENMRKKAAKKKVDDDVAVDEIEEVSEEEKDDASNECLPKVRSDVHEGAPNNYDMSHTQTTYSAVRNTRAALENILAAVTQALALTEPLTVEKYQQGGLEEKIMGAISDSAFTMNELDLICPKLYKRKFTDCAWVADNIDDIEGAFGVKVPEQFKGMSALLSTKPISDSAAAERGGQMRLTFPYDATHTLHVVPFRED